MKWILTGTACMLLMLTACMAPKKITANNKLKGNWELVLFPSSDKNFAEIFGTRKPTIGFVSNVVSGTTGCNLYSGTYASGDSVLTFTSNFVVTKMACPGYEEQTFLNALNSVNRYHLKETQLELSNNNRVVMVFVKKK